MKPNKLALNEILLIIAIIAILAGIILLAVNQTQDDGRSVSTRQIADVSNILTAVYDYRDATGAVPSTITTTKTEICSSVGANCDGLIDLSMLFENRDFLTYMPLDPSGQDRGAGYQILRTGNTIIVESSDKLVRALR